MAQNPKPDLAAGTDIGDLPDGKMLAGRVNDEDAILLRRGGEFFAFGALCSHYHGELAGGLLVDETIRCPLHHACFSLRSGTALHAPALDPIPCWRVERVGERIFVREKLAPAIPITRPVTSIAKAPASIVIVGGGAAALSAAVSLRREGYANDLTILSADDAAPYDRPNVSKDFLAGSAPGSDPIALQIPGATPDNLLYLRTLSDGRLIRKRVSGAQRAIVLGTGFIGLEAAASLCTQGLEVHVIGRETIPMQRVLGPRLGTALKELHESHHVHFHADATVVGIVDHTYQLSDGSRLEADFMIAGIGARPRTELAQQAGLALDRGVAVDEYLQTSAPYVYAAGDIARYPAHFLGDRIRVEHWALAQRQGETAARNMLGFRERFTTVPFFWTQQFDLAINYVGHAESWDAISIEGSIRDRHCAVRYLRAARTLAVATIGMDLDSLSAELGLESGGASLT